MNKLTGLTPTTHKNNSYFIYTSDLLRFLQENHSFIQSILCRQ